ncbi:WD40-repeat-containing domain protein [Endogone sp. FLAS-F59071]|nr:WD40-repeat-containing domain protein [Endogone sp. FLAS-F59071]|eukprot:RUS16500.1 WD40-repeat-containing domain protein [Endogone sp. FLAS-F59071]
MQKRKIAQAIAAAQANAEAAAFGNLIAQFKSVDGETTGPPLNLPADTTPEQLQLLINELLGNSEDPLPYAFYVEDAEITKNIHADVIQGQKRSTEDAITIVYQPQAVFRVRAVTRCSSTLSGHTEAVLSCAFSPDGSQLATGSARYAHDSRSSHYTGDTTVRVWDLNTETPEHTLTGHKNWVLYIAWSPDGQTLASGSMDNTVRLWDPKTGKPLGDALKGHTKWITCLAWEPFHLNPKSNRLASSSKDHTVRIWDTSLRRIIMVISQHTAAVTCIKWGGEEGMWVVFEAWFSLSLSFLLVVCMLVAYYLDYATRARVLSSKLSKVMVTGIIHIGQVNTLALSTDFVLRTGPFDHTGKLYKTEEEGQAIALERYKAAKGNKPERLVSGSDDFTMFFWEPETSKKYITRLIGISSSLGHQKLVNHVSFSPDGRLVASASFDNSVKLWDGNTGKFIVSLRGHVAPVYQVCWSSDSRLLISSSKDTTLKIWDLKTKKIKLDLPGHIDEVFCVDWSPGGDKVASGGKDRQLKV